MYKEERGQQDLQPTPWCLTFPFRSEQDMKMVEGKHEQTFV